MTRAEVSNVLSPFQGAEGEVIDTPDIDHVVVKFEVEGEEFAVVFEKHEVVYHPSWWWIAGLFAVGALAVAVAYWLFV